jgi:hypothetical protein
VWRAESSALGTPLEDADPQDEDSSIDPEDLYPEDEFDVEKELLEQLQDQVAADVRHDIEMLGEGSRRNSGPRRYLARPLEEANQRLMDDYFTKNPLYNSTIFLRIVNALGEWSPFSP